MAENADIRDVEKLRDFHTFLGEFVQSISNRIEDSQLQLDRVERWIQEEAPLYWRQQLQRAEQKFSEARDALALCRAKVREDDHEACTDQAIQLERAKRRLEFCRNKSKLVQQCQRAWDQFLQQHRSAFVQPMDLADTQLPTARDALASILQILDEYSN